jgi:hypothetical protein
MKKFILILISTLVFAGIQFDFVPLFRYSGSTQNYRQFWWADSGYFVWQYSATGELVSEIITALPDFRGAVQFLVEVDTAGTAHDSILAYNRDYSDSTLYTHVFDSLGIQFSLRKYIKGPFTTQYKDWPLTLLNYATRDSIDTLGIDNVRTTYIFRSDPTIAFGDSVNGWQGELFRNMALVAKATMADDSVTTLKIKAAYELYNP